MHGSFHESLISSKHYLSISLQLPMLLASMYTGIRFVVVTAAWLCASDVGVALVASPSFCQSDNCIFASLTSIIPCAETAMIWETLMWKAWVAATVDSTTSPYFLVMFAFATRKARPQWAAAAMWARATRLRQAHGDGDEVCSSVACAVSALSLVPPSQAYVLGRDWWPACPDPTSMVTIDDMRRELVHLSK